MRDDERPDCYRCRSFFVTYDAQHPYGCRTFEMKSRSLPSATVLEASGRPCGAFERRPEAAPPAERNP